jgi:hypothetical protein
MLAKKGELSIARELDVSDLHVEVIDLMNNRVEGETLAFLSFRNTPLLPDTSVLPPPGPDRSTGAPVRSD